MCRATRDGARARPTQLQASSWLRYLVQQDENEPKHTHPARMWRVARVVLGARKPLSLPRPPRPRPSVPVWGDYQETANRPPVPGSRALCSGKGRTGEKTRGPAGRALRPSFGLVRRLAPLHVHLVRVTLRSQSRLLVRHSFSSGGHESSYALAVLLQRLSLATTKVDP